MSVPRIPIVAKIAVVLFSLIAALSQSSALAQEPSKTPILRIETGTHEARINGAAVDPANRFLVTASLDKTLRIWEMASGRIIRVFRPPIDNAIVGVLLAVAISPDGNTIACGGRTSARPGDESIYIIDRASGSIIRRVQGFPSGVLGLAYSKDGNFLAASISKNGIRLFETQTYKLIAEDKQDGSSGLSAEFTPNGRLVTSSDDGYIRLYDARNGLIAKRKVTGDKQGVGISVSPDGGKVAVGLYDSLRVSVLSTTDFSPLYSPDTTGVIGTTDLAGLGAVAWSADGSSLFAGGNFVVDRKTFIRRWAGGGRGPYQDLPASRGGITNIISLKDGGILFATTEPAFGALNVDGTMRFSNGPKSLGLFADNPAEIKRMLEGFLISADARTIQLGDRDSTVRFSLAEKRLEQSPAPLDSLKPPLTQSPGLNITDWFLTKTPKLNGKPLNIANQNMSFGLSIAADGNSFLLFDSFFINSFGPNGALRWKVPAYDASFGGISGDGRVAAAALSDGTIRWYRMTDGKELLALFPHSDKKRWVLWTPSGYYDASPGGEDFIGWHLNNGPDQTADFFPVGQFRSSYYRPDIIAKVLETLDETVAVRLANEESGRKQRQADLSQTLPPVVEIASPMDSAEVSGSEITVKFRVRMPSGEPVTGIKTFVDGRPVNAGRGMKLSVQPNDLQEMKVTVPEQDSEISIIAENKYSASVPAIVRVKWRGAVAKDEFVVKPKLYVLAIGISQYENKDLSLGFAAKDARDFTAAMELQKGGLYRDVVIKLLTDEKATKDEILDGLDWIRKETTSKDVAMVFMAGHGVTDQNGFYFFCPYNIDPEKILRTGVPFTDIKNTVASLAGKALFFVDTCHSGNVMGARRGIVDVTGIVNELSSAENGAVVFAASTGNQYSLENAAWGNGAFTKALVEALTGRADYGGKGKITINMIDLYVSERVKELTKGKQTPTTTKPQTVADFPVVVKQ